MEGYDREFWQFSDQLRLQNNFSNLSIADSIWSSSTSPNNSLPDQSVNASSWKLAAPSGPGLIGSGSKLAFGNATTTNADRYNYFPAGAPDAKSNTNNSGGLAFSKGVNGPAAGLGNDYYFSKNAAALNANTNAGGDVIKSYFNKSIGRAASNSNSNSSFGVGKKNAAAHDKKKSAGSGNGNGAGVDKRFKSLPASEALPRGEAIGGYIFVCNNDTMEENLKRQLFGLPSRYRDSVRAIRPGLPLFLYNYSTHQLHGIFEAASFGGSNIDPTAWEDKKCPGESRFPAQVSIKIQNHPQQLKIAKILGYIVHPFLALACTRKGVILILQKQINSSKKERLACLVEVILSSWPNLSKAKKTATSLA
ncbi:hypothetical protein PVAP13_3NG177974 [Panicum virgatum]|uniref:DCD domain-containing protein n=1 Tax=Panicum virgatum TaxID=38727 RepID=A0A8T0U3Y0_PANVG|nr:hypothetical protein PVAP13_3NG177974 [Panicum virgatum]